MAIPAGFHVEVCDWSNASEREALLGVRDDVFVREQHVPLDLDRDDDDPRSAHVLARALDGAAVGTGRLAPDGRIGRMAVLGDWRGRGIGTMLLHTLLDLARTRRLAAVTAHAQRNAIPFYARHGFEAEGNEFEEAGIPHLRMRRGIDPRAAPERPPLPPAPPPVHLHANSREELIAVTQKLLAGARHGMCVLVRELHPMLLNDTACLVELRRLAISGRGASIRMIAQDLTRALNEGTRLLELAQRLSSVVELRRPVDPADLNYRSAFMCVDTQGYLFRPIEHQMATTGSTYSPGRHGELMRLFEEVWNRSVPWPELRALGI
ncbi:MAG TPA: GNAT family N-acetyltransferase [Rhodanobacteraceae bacterium]|jgi:predicted GNAT family N-acyltransferase|nr:GNAT family N-acetyltransferase [Rhodanobacteraceae bacterium]